MTAKLTIALALAAALGALLVSSAFGHADYESSTPADGATVTAPTRVDAYFSAELDTTGANSLNVLNPSGTDVDNNDSTVDAADGTHMSVTLQANLPAGEYTVEWTTVSAEDGEEDSGTFSFTVAAPAAATTAAPGSTPAPQAPVTGYGPLSAENYHSPGILFLALATLGTAAFGAGLIARSRSQRA